MNADEQCVHDVVAGVGVNVHQRAFEGDLAQTASSLDLLTGKENSRAEVARAFLQTFEQTDALTPDALMQAYRECSATLGQRVRVSGNGESFVGLAVAVTDSGSLIVRDDAGNEREVLAADVSVRGLMGYA